MPKPESDSLELHQVSRENREEADRFMPTIDVNPYDSPRTC